MAAFLQGVRHVGFPSFDNGETEESGREVVIGVPTPGGVEVLRKIYVPDDQGFARYLEVVTNNSATVQNYSVAISSNLGIGQVAMLVADSSGDDVLDNNDLWSITDDADGTGAPAILHFVGAAQGIRADNFSVTTGSSIDFRYDLLLDPGETQIVMHFVAQSASRADALFKATELTKLGLDATEGMSAEEIQQIVNFELPDDDLFEFSVTAGDSLAISTLTPMDGIGEFQNLLDPAIELLDPTGAVVAFDDNSAADGRNAMLSHLSALTGMYSVRVLGTRGSAGEYLLNVAGATGESGMFSVESSMPNDQARLTAPPTIYEVRFNDFIDLSTLHPNDLVLDGTPLTEIASIPDGKRVVFTLPSIGVGQHTLQIAEGAILDLQGDPVNLFNATLTVDVVAPRVIASSTLEGEVVPAGEWTYVAQFNEELDASSLDVSDVRLVGQFTGPHVPTFFQYNEGSATLTLAYPNLVEDFYSLTLVSGTGALEDIAGNDLDGERNETTTVPSGNGILGGDFVLNFEADSVSTSLSFDRLLPLGSFLSSSRELSLINGVGDQDDFTFFVENGQTLSAAVVPDDSSVTMTIELVAVTTPFSALAPGQKALLPITSVTNTGSYILRITGDGSTVYTLDLIRNGSREDQAGDTGISNPLAIDASAVILGSNRFAVLGTSETTRLDQQVLPDVDQYTVSLIGRIGQPVDVILAGQNGADFSTELLELLDSSGNVLATAETGPNGAAATNYDLGIFGFAVPADDTYALRLTTLTDGDYGLVVTDSLTFDSEPNDNLDGPTTDLTLVNGIGNAVGFLDFPNQSIVAFGANNGFDFKQSNFARGSQSGIEDANSEGSTEAPCLGPPTRCIPRRLRPFFLMV